MARLPFIAHDEFMLGAGDPLGGADTLNRGLRALLTESGHDPDADPFPGIIPVFNVKPFIAANSNIGAAGVSAAATAAGLKGIYFPAGTTDIGTNLTISVPVQFAPEAKIRPASGVTVTFAHIIKADAHQLFDFSLGGNISFNGNRALRQYLPQWFGVLGEGAPESAAMNRMIQCVPDGAEILFSQGMNVTLDQNPGFHIGAGRTGIKLLGIGDPRQGDGVGMTRMTYTGPAGGVVSFIDSSTFISVEQFNVNSGAADVVFDLDGYNGHIGSNCILRRNIFGNVQNRDTWVGVRISETVTNNHEYHEIRENVIWGAYGPQRWFNGLSMTTGSNVLTRTAGPTFDTTPGSPMIGARVWVMGAGASGSVLATTIVSITDANTAVLAANASATVANQQGAMSMARGKGIKVSSTNTHRLQFKKNDIHGLQYGVYFEGGSFQSNDNQTFACDVNWYINGGSLPSYSLGDNSEVSMQHIVWAGGQAPLICNGPRINVAITKPGAAHIEVTLPRPLIIDAMIIENSVPTGSTVFKLPQYGPSAHIRGVFDGLAISMEEFGVDLAVHSVELFRRSGGAITGSEAPATHMFGGGVLGYANGNQGQQFGLRGELKHRSDESLDFKWGAGILGSVSHIYLNQDVWGPVPVQTLTGMPNRSPRKAEYWGFGVCGTAETLPGATQNVGGKVGSFHARLPIMAVAPANGIDAVGMLVSGVELDGVAHYSTSYGIIIEPLQDAVHSPAAYGVKQEGTKDKNEFAGPMAIQGSFARAGVQDAGTVASGGSVTPQVDRYSEVRVSSLGALTINNPTGVIYDGTRLLLSITNSSGGLMTVTLGGDFVGGFTPPGNTLTSTKEFRWNAAAGKWQPAGAQSPDF